MGRLIVGRSEYEYEYDDEYEYELGGRRVPYSSKSPYSKISLIR